MTKSLRVVIIGGVAAGPKVASKIIRLNPQAEVTVIEKEELFSYAGCGLPYYVSGVVHSKQELMSTPAGVVRDSVFFQNVKNVHVRTKTEAVEIDRKKKQVKIRDLKTQAEELVPYDKLVIATGAIPVIPRIPGIGKQGVFTLHGMHDAEGIKVKLEEGKAKDVVIIGGGLIGVEMTEALVACGCRVTLVEMLPQILGILDWEMAHLVQQHMESKGVRVMTECKALSIEGHSDRNEVVAHVVTDIGAIPADMVILSIGVKPNVTLAAQTGLTIGEKTKAIEVDDHMCTSDPDIYSAGDCVECRDIIMNKPCYVPLGSTANKQGRIAAINICGGDDSFPGVLGSTVCKVFDYCVGRTGLTEATAREAGYNVVTALSPAPDKAHYIPTAKTLMLKLVLDKKTRKLLGAQTLGPGNGDKRIDVAAMAISSGMTVDQLAKADLCYAPPYSPAMDNIITACDISRNKLDGFMTGITPMEVHKKIKRHENFMFLDVRSKGEWDEVRLPKSELIPLGALRKRVNELPKDKEIITFCKISLRGYEAALILKAAGFKNVKVMDGGVVMWPYEKEH